MAWLPIRYRGFYDVPRAFVVERAGAVYFFDSPFDDEADEYPDRYLVYRLHPGALPDPDAGAWAGLERAGSLVGEVAVARVPFDETRRAFVDDSVFDGL